MEIELLRKNIAAEKEIIKETFILASQLNNADKPGIGGKRDEEKKLLNDSINSMIRQLEIINNSIPMILEPISPYKKIGETRKIKDNLASVPIVKDTGEKINIAIGKEEKESFIKEYSMNRNLLKHLLKNRPKKTEEHLELKNPGFYAKISNKAFLSLSSRLIEKGYFKKIRVNLRKINFSYLLATYISMSFFTSLLVFTGALIYLVFSLFFSDITLLRIGISLLVLIFSPIAAFFAFYFYPYLEIKSMEKSIESELPFVTINLSAIAGGGIEPSNMFKIIASGDEYPATKKEMNKIINQINLYGYDLVTALRNTSRETSSSMLAELLNGLATTISGGGKLTDFLNKRAESMLFEYRINKEKETRFAETVMDLYISMVVTAPMIMTLLLILMSVGLGSGIGLSSYALSYLMIGVVALINILFLIGLQLRGRQ